MNPTQTLLTAEELLLLPDDGCRHELVDGELRTTALAGSEHSVIAVRLTHIVAVFVHKRDLGLVFGAEGGFRVRSDPNTVRAPDLAFVRRERIPPSGIPKGFWPGVPDLAAEVISPSERYEEVDEKVAMWLEAGAEIVWVLNPRRKTVAVHSGDGTVRLLAADEELSGGALLPGFACAVAELFP